jgi:predicted ester cyclase
VNLDTPVFPPGGISELPRTSDFRRRVAASDLKGGSDVAEDNAALVRRFYDEVINGGKLDTIDELIAPDFVEHQEFPGLEQTREGVKQFFAMWRKAFPDTHGEIELLVADGDVVAVYGTWSGTHEGEFMGMPATGSSRRTDGCRTYGRTSRRMSGSDGQNRQRAQSDGGSGDPNPGHPQ